MSLEELRATRKKVVGARETAKVAERGQAAHVFIARDADERVVRGIVRACRDRGIPITYVESMPALGRACGIEVGAAAAAILGQDDRAGARLEPRGIRED